MTVPARVFVVILVVTRAARPQTPEELAQTAAHAMQHQDYATAEKAYRQFIQLSPDGAEVLVGSRSSQQSRGSAFCAFFISSSFR